MEYAKVVYVLDITWLEIQRETKLLCQKVKRIKSFRLSFGDRRYVVTSGKVKKPSK